MSLIAVNNLSRKYGDYLAVDNISFKLSAGDILGFLGPNGAGKSTTMNILSGNIAPSEGEILINGIDLLDKPKAAKAHIGYLPEQPPLYREMTVDEYLSYAARLHRLSGHTLTGAVELAKKRCGLLSSGSRLIANLSKGYQQRVGIAQAIVHAPPVIILDEPTVGLDPNQIREIRQLITELGKDHGIILCTHILPEVQAVCTRVQIIHQGRFVYESDMRQLLERQNTGAYEIKLQRPPLLDEFHSIDCIEKVQQLDNKHFLVTISDQDAEYLTKLSVKNNWGLSELIPHERTLEQIFVDLTLGDSNTDTRPPSASSTNHDSGDNIDNTSGSNQLATEDSP